MRTKDNMYKNKQKQHSIETDLQKLQLLKWHIVNGENGKASPEIENKQGCSYIATSVSVVPLSE